MTNEELFKKLNEDHPIEEMVKFNELNFQEKLKVNASQIMTYKDFYHKELSRFEYLTDLMDKLIGIRYKFYRFEDTNEWTKPEIEKFCIPGDRRILRMKKILHRQEIRVRFFETCWRGFEKQNWSMKVFMDTLKQGY
jgi:hypothetical protein